jgi:hypothetical protein
MMLLALSEDKASPKRGRGRLAEGTRAEPSLALESCRLNGPHSRGTPRRPKELWRVGLASASALLNRQIGIVRDLPTARAFSHL